MARGVLRSDCNEVSAQDRIKLRTIEIALNAGLSRVAEKFLNRFSEWATSSQSNDVHICWERFRAEIDAMKAIEKVHGLGALLNLQHPSIRRLLLATKDDGTPAISSEMLLAAHRYSEDACATSPVAARCTETSSASKNLCAETKPDPSK